MAVYDRLNPHQSIYESELRDNIIPFWEKYCLDHEYGGYFTCLDRDGKVTHLLKGGKWKGFFHLPRMLMICTQLFGSSCP